MKKISYGIFILLATLCGMFGACSEFEPTGYTEIPDLQKVSNLRADIDGYVVNLSWSLPAADGVEGVLLITNGNSSNPTRLEGSVTSYSVEGQPMEEEYLYTVKVLYNGGYVSEGVSVTATIPYIELANVTDLEASVSGRTVTLNWTLPDEEGITAVKVFRADEADAAVVLEASATSCEMKGQPMDQELTYTVALVYDEYYTSKGTSVQVTVPYITPKMGYLMTAATIQQLPDDDERAAAAWFMEQENAELIQPSQLADLDADIYPVLWIEIDRVGLPLGWENLPAEITSDETIAALRQYSANGGSLSRPWLRSSPYPSASCRRPCLPRPTVTAKAGQVPTYGPSIPTWAGTSATAATRDSTTAPRTPYTRASRWKTPTTTATTACRSSVPVNAKTTTACGIATSTGKATTPT